MTGVALRDTWITRAMSMGPWSGARPPIWEAIVKKMYTYHLDWAPWLLVKTHSPLRIIKKKISCMDFYLRIIFLLWIFPENLIFLLFC